MKRRMRFVDRFAGRGDWLNSPKRRGNAFIQIAAMLGVLLVVVAVVIPALLFARMQARLSQCRNNFRQVALALSNYHDTHSAFPLACIGNSRLAPDKRFSCSPFLGSYLADAGIPQLDLDLAWDDPAQQPWQSEFHHKSPEPKVELIPLRPDPSFLCPNGDQERRIANQPVTQTLLPTGLEPDGATLPADDPQAGMWAYHAQRSLQDVVDGENYVLLLIESGYENGCWLAGGRHTARGLDRTSQLPLIGQGGQFGGLHSEGAMAAMADGSVTVLASGIDPTILADYFTLASHPETKSDDESSPAEETAN